jgi:HK97 gp10 family phage protein
MKFDARIRITRVVNPGEVGRQITPKMEALGQAIGARAQRLVPKRTWALHDSISVDTESNGARVVTTVGAGGGDVDYAMHVERGTSKMRAQPYLRPAFAQTTGRDLKYSGKGTINHSVKVETARQRRNERRRAAYVGSKK